MTSDKTTDQVPCTVLNIMGSSFSKAATGEATQEIPRFYGTRFHNRAEKSLLPGLMLNEINSIHILSHIPLRYL